jgi:hypothetical protein
MEALTRIVKLQERYTSVTKAGHYRHNTVTALNPIGTCCVAIASLSKQRHKPRMGQEAPLKMRMG